METNLEDAVAAVRELRPSVLVVNKCFGSHTIMDWLRIMHADALSAAVVVRGLADERIRSLAFPAGGNCRRDPPDRIPGRVGFASARSSPAAVGWRAAILRDKERCVRTGRSALTSREMQVMDRVGRAIRIIRRSPAAWASARARSRAT